MRHKILMDFLLPRYDRSVVGESVRTNALAPPAARPRGLQWHWIGLLLRGIAFPIALNPQAGSIQVAPKPGFKQPTIRTNDLGTKPVLVKKSIVRTYWCFFPVFCCGFFLPRSTTEKRGSSNLPFSMRRFFVLSIIGPLFSLPDTTFDQDSKVFFFVRPLIENPAD